MNVVVTLTCSGSSTGGGGGGGLQWAIAPLMPSPLSPPMACK